MIDPQKLEKAKLVQRGLQQFDARHIPVEIDEKGEVSLYCSECGTDYPCERMLLFMVVQSVAAFSAMLPTGNMGAVMGRFINGGKS